MKGDNTLDAGIPESFNVLVKEMESLGLEVKVGYTNPTGTAPKPMTPSQPSLANRPETEKDI